MANNRFWLARDKSGSLGLFKYKPFKIKNERAFQWNCNNPSGYPENSRFDLDTELFPEVQWDSKPIEVMLVPTNELNNEIFNNKNLLKEIHNKFGEDYNEGYCTGIIEFIKKLKKSFK